MRSLQAIVQNHWKVAAVVAAAFVAGALVRGGPEPMAESGAPAAAEAAVWTCSMHPQIQLPEPGKCPICFMDLIPLEAAEGDAPEPGELSVSAAAAARMELATALVERRFAEAEVRMVGKVAYDETRLATITSWVPGRLERLYVDYTGTAVRQGDHLVELYSPELLSAQQELLQAAAAARRLEGGSEAARGSAVPELAAATLGAARDKLRLWGLSADQVRAIEERGEAGDRVTIHAPAGGIVVHLNAREGMYVQTGTPIYIIADLSRVWVELDAYESDLPWVRYGQEVTFTTEAHPGQSFRGTVSFIQPVLDEGTRTVKVRVIADNPSMGLKPGMFVRARLRARLDADGRAVSPSLAGKWIGPMHPEVVKDGPGSCDVCGMPLVPAAELGYAAAEAAGAPLVIPDTAPLLTGRRAVVYVEVAGRPKPTYAGREVVLGPRAGGFYTVLEGLSEGERVVTRGAFKLDAELQIRARPSMMAPAAAAADEGQGHGGHGAPVAAMEAATAQGQAAAAEAIAGRPAPAAGAAVPKPFAGELAGVATAYLDLQEALAADDGKAASAAAAAARASLDEVDTGPLAGEAHTRWMSQADSLRAGLGRLEGAGDLGAARQHFQAVSRALLGTLGHFGAPVEGLYRAHCPMALDFSGADWIQEGEQISNPYFGASMLRCGTIEEALE